MTRNVLVAGVGMIAFRKPGDSLPYHEMGAQAVREALADAGIGYELIEQVYAGYVYGDSTSGQRAVYGKTRNGRRTRARRLGAESLCQLFWVMKSMFSPRLSGRFPATTRHPITKTT